MLTIYTSPVLIPAGRRFVYDVEPLATGIDLTTDKARNILHVIEEAAPVKHNVF